MPIPPQAVHSPLNRWKMHTVVHNVPDWALAIGTWDGNRALVCRWNGDQDHPLGNPVSHARPTWFVLPEDFWEPLLKLAEPAEAHTARVWLGMEAS